MVVGEHRNADEIVHETEAGCGQLLYDKTYLRMNPGASHHDGTPASQRAVLRITCIISSLGLGGAQRNILRLTEGLVRAGHAVTLLTLNSRTPDFFEVPPNVARVGADPVASASRHWLNVPGNIRRYLVLRKAILDTRPDVVVSFIDVTNVHTLIALIGSNVPVVVSERSDPRHHPIGWRWRLLRYMFYRRAARVVLVTEDSRKWAQFLPPGLVTVIHNAVVEPAVRVPCDANARAIVAIGRLSSEKCFDQLICAFAFVADRFPGWTLRLIGEGPQRTALEEQVRAGGLEGRVELAGSHSDPHAKMTDAAFLVLTSRYEGFNMALAEAMAAGLPVISFDCPSGPREIIRADVDGILVPPQDVQSLAAAMTRLMEDVALRSALAGRAGEICERFPLSTFIAQWRAVIEASARVAA